MTAPGITTASAATNNPQPTPAGTDPAVSAPMARNTATPSGSAARSLNSSAVRSARSAVVPAAGVSGGGCGASTAIGLGPPLFRRHDADLPMLAGEALHGGCLPGSGDRPQIVDFPGPPTATPLHRRRGRHSRKPSQLPLNRDLQPAGLSQGCARLRAERGPAAGRGARRRGRRLRSAAAPGSHRGSRSWRGSRRAGGRPRRGRPG